MARIAATLVLGASASALAAADVDAVRDPCRYSFGNSTFNLQALARASGYYRVMDASNNPGSTNYTYYMNVCLNMQPNTTLPGDAANACQVTYPGTGFTSPTYAKSGPAPAFQYAEFPVQPADKCHRLGDTLASTTFSYGLFDPTNPSRGVTLTYTGGDACPSNLNQQRSLKLWLLCDNDVLNIPDTELVEETSGCHYEIFLRSAYGCPAECPISLASDGSTNQLCSAHGICDFDAAIGKPRCFCNDGYEGSDCSSAVVVQSGLSAAGGVLIGVCIFLAITMGFLVYLWMRIRSLRLDPTAYSALRAGPDDGAAATIN